MLHFLTLIKAVSLMCLNIRPASVEEVAEADAVDVVAGYHVGQSSPLTVEIGGVRLSLEGALLVVERGGGRRARFLPDKYEARPAAVVETACFERVVAALVKALREAGLLSVYKIDFAALDMLGVMLHEEKDAATLLALAGGARGTAPRHGRAGWEDGGGADGSQQKAGFERRGGGRAAFTTVAEALRRAGVRPAFPLAVIVLALAESFTAEELSALASRVEEVVERLRELL